jgi:predicted DNA-binding protein
MVVNLSPDLEAKLNELSTTTGRATDDLVQDVMASYFDELTGLRGMLDRSFDDVKGGKVRAIEGEEAFARLRHRM